MNFILLCLAFAVVYVVAAVVVGMLDKSQNDDLDRELAQFGDVDRSLFE